jgi:uncharacterized protein DUF1329
MRIMRCIAGAALVVFQLTSSILANAAVTPGDVITSENAAVVADLVSPGNFVLVEQGMRMTIVPTGRLDWPPPYKAATEKYSSQVTLNAKGELQKYVAGLPFPFIDLNDPQAANKIVWNFSYGPQTADFIHARNIETSSYRDVGPPGSFLSKILPAELFHSTAAHLVVYNLVGRTELPPVPTDPNSLKTGVRSRFYLGPILEGGGAFLRYRYIDPNRDDAAWYYALGRVAANMLSTSTGTTILDPDSYGGFGAKIEDFNYRLLGLRSMLASVRAEHSPETPCPYDNDRTICPENWELRQLYVIEATQKPSLMPRKIARYGNTIPKRILYIDSEGWFITASDQYDNDGALWKTLAIFNAYRDRGMPTAREAVYPFNRMIQTAIVDEDIRTGFSTVSYLPGKESEEREGWYIDPGAAPQSSSATSAIVNRPAAITRPAATAR